ncbi:MAG TPA: zinc-binding dehydrogenase [Chthonomonadaceae bacterium]|nr:zinc-binding dehydrogenase [Chthonomonadaceae bacterium]
MQVGKREMARAAVMPGPGLAPEVRRYPVPEVEPGAVLLKTIASEVCGTDVHLWHGRLAGVPYPLIPGHVSVGRVEATGGEIRDADGVPVRPGDVITFLDVHGTCNSCWYCLVAKATTRCPHRRVYGITYGAEDAPGLSGGWSERIYLRPGTKIVGLAEGVSPEAWIGGGCGLPTAVHAIDLAQIRLGDRVLIQGSGPVGLSACALAMLSGAGWVGVLGAPAQRLKAAEAMGADWRQDVTQTTREERARAVRDVTGGRGPDIVIEASGNPEAVPEGCELVRDAGRYVIVGQYTDNGSIELNPHLHINRKHLEIRGCWGSDYSHVYRAMEILARFGRRVDWSALITRRYGLSEVGAALADVEARRVVKAVIVPE